MRSLLLHLELQIDFSVHLLLHTVTTSPRAVLKASSTMLCQSALAAQLRLRTHMADHRSEPRGSRAGIVPCGSVQFCSFPVVPC